MRAFLCSIVHRSLVTDDKNAFMNELRLCEQPRRCYFTCFFCFFFYSYPSLFILFDLSERQQSGIGTMQTEYLIVSKQHNYPICRKVKERDATGNHHLPWGVSIPRKPESTGVSCAWLCVLTANIKRHSRSGDIFFSTSPMSTPYYFHNYFKLIRQMKAVRLDS